MAESTLSVWQGQLRIEVADHLGWGRASGNWDGTLADRLTQITNAGLRQFYFNGYEWSFLRDNITLSTWTSNTGTIASVTATTITSTDVVTPFDSTMVGHTLIAGENEYTITAVNSATQVTVGSDPTADDGNTFTIDWDNYYTLPDGYGGIDGPLTYEANTGYRVIQIIGEAQLRAYRMYTQSGYPAYAAIRPLSFVAATGQRYAMELYPTPGGVYTLTYRQVVLPDTISTAALYHRGGAIHAETVLASCIAIADQRYNEGQAQISFALYQQRLQQSIANDSKLNGPNHFGYNGDGSDRARYRTSRGITDNNATYSG